MRKFQINSRFTLKRNNEEVEIIEKIKGGKSNKTNYQSGIMFTGYKSKPCTYLLSNGQQVTGQTLNQMIINTKSN